MSLAKKTFREMTHQTGEFLERFASSTYNVTTAPYMISRAKRVIGETIKTMKKADFPELTAAELNGVAAGAVIGIALLVPQAYLYYRSPLLLTVPLATNLGSRAYEWYRDTRNKIAISNCGRLEKEL